MSTNDFSLGSIFAVTGKVVVITGGGTGIGKGNTDPPCVALAKGFAQNGARVYITGRRADVLHKAAEELHHATKGGKVVAIEGDVSSKDGCAAIAQSVAKHESKASGRGHDSISPATSADKTQVDVLINCAGVLLPSERVQQVNDVDQVEKSLWGVDDDHWRQTFDINVNVTTHGRLRLTRLNHPQAAHVAAPHDPRTEDTEAELIPTAGTYFMTIASLPLLRKSADPRVINIASALGWTGYETRAFGTISYNASKAAVIHMTENLAARLAPAKIRVNALAPGLFPTEMTEGKGKEGGGMPPPLVKSGLRAPLGEYSFSFSFSFKFPDPCPPSPVPFHQLAPPLRSPTRLIVWSSGGTEYPSPIRSNR
ncbi:hypothetical protein EHS25_009279 [Saitozyma podzolica]|uniref:NAD(P)-binding protein n=1 Tax=Saitozyma podzolica TaxID=1890683 RepID=A0A427YLI2_9TREE|nr:hypothetical protein EHS25_009279 [Saitozyma podzolica]